MNAFLYNGLIEHHRHKPKDHQFSYPLYVYGFDLEELPEMDRRLPFFGYNRFRPASVHDKDYLDSGPGSIREKLDRFLAKEGFGDAVARAFLITSPRYFNYVFNPVSFYYLFRADGALVGNVAEVNNTFGEKHLYILRSPDRGNGDRTATYRTEKAFHVSPFNRIEGSYEFFFADIAKELDVGIDIRQAGEVVFEARLRGTPEPLTASSQMKMFLRHPIAPHLSVPRILYEAAKLSFGKKLTYHDKPVPLSPMTIRTNPPTFVQRKCMGAAFNVLGRAGNGSLRMTLPDGSSKTLGEATSADHAEIIVKDWRFFSRLVFGGDIGLGESYMDAEWETPDLTTALAWFIRNWEAFFGRYERFEPLFDRLNRVLYPISENTITGSKKNIITHYDLGNEFFEVFLDPSMTYSCARYLNGKDTLEEAQKNKLQAMIRKAAIGPDDHVLEIGCGWGSFAVEAVRTTGLPPHGGHHLRCPVRVCPRAHPEGRPRGPRGDRPAGLPRDQGPLRPDRLHRDARGRGPQILRDVLRVLRSAPQARRRHGPAVHLHPGPSLRTLPQGPRLDPQAHLPRGRASVAGHGDEGPGEKDLPQRAGRGEHRPGLRPDAA